jgi:hypothetical protein
VGATQGWVGATESGVLYTQRRVSVTLDLDRNKYPCGYFGESEAPGSDSQELREAERQKVSAGSMQNQVTVKIT